MWRSLTGGDHLGRWRIATAGDGAGDGDRAAVRRVLHGLPQSRADRTHGLGLLRQRIFGLALGYEDLNDHDKLRYDPLLAVLVGKEDPTGQDACRVRDRGKALAGKSTLNRLELTPVRADEKSRYKKIVATAIAFSRSFLTSSFKPMTAADADRPGPGRHRRSAARASSGTLLSRLLRELLLLAAVYFLRRALALCAVCGLRTSTAPAGSVKKSSASSVQIRARWPEVRIVVRGDSGFCREPMMAWCEENRVDYVFGLAKNDRLIAEISQELAEAKQEYEKTGQASRVFKDFTYRDAQQLELRASRGGQGRASFQREQPAFRGDVAADGRVRRAECVRRRVLCAGRHGEPHQGATVAPVRRPHELRDDASEPVAAMAFVRGVYVAGGASSPGFAAHGLCRMRSLTRFVSNC